ALYDDAGQKGGFTGKGPFVILGDLNADEKSDPIYTGEVAIQTLLKHPRVVDYHHFTQSVGGLQGREAGAPNFWERATADFLNGARVDYVLASDNLKVNGGGVHWPDPVTEPAANFVALKASDHRLVWLDVELPAAK
ncbi:MAG: endonuclease/exonuclease/phosphatase family protein, partial [Candidatus Sumerlaeia bacterium]|nr:endonuclease/exonuclease/phosphatase family protein [Candidatus Sumerlaeia bacterium]